MAPNEPVARRSSWRGLLRRPLEDGNFLELMDRGEQQLAKVLALLLLLVMAATSLQLIALVGSSLVAPDTPWLESRLMVVLGDLLNLLIALEVLQNITSYLRRHVVQIELVLLTALTAVARKVIVLPQGAEGKPLLLLGLGVALVAIAASFWLVRNVREPRDPTSAGPATRSRVPDP